jgi:ribosomal protein S27AE
VEKEGEKTREDEEEEMSQPKTCPKCGQRMLNETVEWTCPRCGYTQCIEPEYCPPESGEQRKTGLRKE